MAEYIEREDLIAELDELISNISFTSPYQDEIDRMIAGAERARDLVYDAPAADVVEVVRCKDCKYRYFNKGHEEYYCKNWSGLCQCVNKDDFCSYGERRCD